MGAAGALIRTSAPVPSVGTPIRLRVALPADRPWAGPHVASTGHVVGIRAAGHNEQVLLAVSICKSRLWPDLCGPAHDTRTSVANHHSSPVTAARSGRRHGRTVNRPHREKR
jgi:hypothetical protein